MADQKNHHPLALALFSLLSALLVADALYHYTILPGTVATHFGMNGSPDAWAPKLVFFFWYFIFTLIVAGIYTGVRHILLPGHHDWLNIPNKEYWLAPERRHETLAYLRTGFLLFGSGTLLFVLDLVHQAFQVSLGDAATLTHQWTSIALYALFCVIWALTLNRRFSRKR